MEPKVFVKGYESIKEGKPEVFDNVPAYWKQDERAVVSETQTSTTRSPYGQSYAVEKGK